MSKHRHQATQAATTAADAHATDPWLEWVKTVLANTTQQPTATTPFYDRELRELRVGPILVKRFTQASDAQEILLLVFQEENWGRCIDDPLPVKDEQEAKHRLRAAVYNLNRRQRVPLLPFRVIRRGTGVFSGFFQLSGRTGLPFRVIRRGTGMAWEFREVVRGVGVCR